MSANTCIFQLSDETIKYWNDNGLHPVENSEIATLEDYIGAKAPTGYIEFVKVFGGVDFGSNIPNRFSYSYIDNGYSEHFNQVVGHIKRPERALRYYDGLRNDDDLKFPPNLLPFAMDLSQGELFIEFGKPTEQIFYWNFDNHDWTNTHMRLGFVAHNMYDFLNNLKLDGGKAAY